MPTELEELVEFLHHGNTEIRQIAAENLVGYSTADRNLFKRNQLEPIKDLKLLVRDYKPIAKNAITILVNLSEDSEIVSNLIEDDTFLESSLRRITAAKESNSDLLCMLLANLAKSSKITKLLTLKRDIPKEVSNSPLAIDQLLDCFVKGASGSYNKDANYDYLSYLFADLAKHEEGRRHFLTPRSESNATNKSNGTDSNPDAGSNGEDVIPFTKLLVFTEHSSTIRRRGVANTIKNVCFDVPSHAALLADEGSTVSPFPSSVEAVATSTSPSTTTGIGVLPYLLLPLMGNEEYSDEDTDGMLDECQLLPPDKEREAQPDIIGTHLESLLLLSTERESRDRLRAVKVYPVVREVHLKVEDQGVREGCDRLVQVLMRGEEGEEEDMPLPPGEMQRVEDLGKVDEDEQVVDVL